VDSSFLFALMTVQVRICCSDTVLATQQNAAAEQSGYCYMWCSRNARAIHLVSPVINKKSGRKLYSSHSCSYERRELSMSKFGLRLTYSTCKNVKKKTHNKKTNLCQLHNKTRLWEPRHGGIIFSSDMEERRRKGSKPIFRLTCLETGNSLWGNYE